MPYKEIFFKISSIKERDLFAYISEVCDCKIINPVVLEPSGGIFQKDIPINSPLYLIVDNSVDFKVQYKKEDLMSEETKYVLEFPQSGKITYISYERFDYCNNTEASNRLFLSYDSFFEQKKSVSVNNFEIIQKWIKNNAKEKIKFGKSGIYLIY